MHASPAQVRQVPARGRRVVPGTPWWSHDAVVVVMCAAVSVGAGWAIVRHPLALLALLAGVAALVVLIAAPLRWIAPIVVFGLLTGPQFATRGVLVADCAVLVALLLVLLRGGAQDLPARYLPWLLFLVWAVAVTGPDPRVLPLVHTFLPLLGGFLLARTTTPETMYRAVRVWAVIAIVTAPLFTEDLGSRWSGLPGGPNELGLLAAALVVLSYAAVRTRWSVAQFFLGFFGLAVSASISAGIAAVAAVLMLRPGTSRRLSDLRLSPLKVALIVGVIAVVAARPDFLVTLVVHGDQAAAATAVLADTNPIVGGGWLHGSEFIATGPLDTRYSFVLYDTVHNAYLQLLTDTGFIGLCLFLLAMAMTWRSASPLGRALLVACAVWLNTTGVYPNAVWGLLAVVIADTMRSRHGAGGDEEVAAAYPTMLAPRRGG